MSNKFSGTKNSFTNQLTVTKEEIDSYLTHPNNSTSNDISINLVSNALLPNKDYLFRYPDTFRIWVNDHPRASHYIRNHFNYTIKHFLISHFGIDIRDNNLRTEHVRKVLSDQEKAHFITKTQFNEQLQFASDSKWAEKYIENRKEIIAEFEKKPEQLREIVNRKVEDLFTSRFKNICKDILARCRDVRDIEKRRTWLRLRKWLFLNRIMEYKSKTNYIESQRGANFGKHRVYFPDSNEVSFLDDVHPEIKRSPYYQLINLFQLSNHTPETALKFITTNPNSKLLDQYELNKSKLAEIKSDLKNNPDKYIDSWLNVMNKEMEQEFEEAEDKDLLMRDTKYRYLNNGASILDECGMKEYSSMRQFWKEYKDGTLASLKKFTQTLIYDIVNEGEVKTSTETVVESVSKINNENMEKLHELYNVVKDDSDDSLTLFEKYYTNKNTNPNYKNEEILTNVKKSIEHTFSNDTFFKEFFTNSTTSEVVDTQNKYINQTRDLVKQLIEKFLVNYLADEVKAEDLNQYDKQLLKSFNESKTGDSNSYTSEKLNKLFNTAPTNSPTIEFIDWLYVKFSSTSLFTQCLEKTKFVVISLLKNLFESEIETHNNNLNNSIKNKVLVDYIFQNEIKESHKILKLYYGLKLHIIQNELLEKLSRSDFNSLSLNDFNHYLKDVSYGIMLNGKDAYIPKSLPFVLLESGRSQERQCVEMIIDLKNMVQLQHTQINDTFFGSSQSEALINMNKIENFQEKNLEALTKKLKNFDYYELFENLKSYMTRANWFTQVKDYIGENPNNLSNDKQINNLKHFINSNNLTQVKIDENVETFIKKDFFNLLNSNSTNTPDYQLDSHYLESTSLSK